MGQIPKQRIWSFDEAVNAAAAVTVSVVAVVTIWYAALSVLFCAMQMGAVVQVVPNVTPQDVADPPVPMVTNIALSVPVTLGLVPHVPITGVFVEATAVNLRCPLGPSTRATVLELLTWNWMSPTVPLVTLPDLICTPPDAPDVDPPFAPAMITAPPVPVAPGVPPVIVTAPPEAVVVVPVPAAPAVIVIGPPWPPTEVLPLAVPPAPPESVRVAPTPAAVEAAFDPNPAPGVSVMAPPVPLVLVPPDAEPPVSVIDPPLFDWLDGAPLAVMLIFPPFPFVAPDVDRVSWPPFPDVDPPAAVVIVVEPPFPPVSGVPLVMRTFPPLAVVVVPLPADPAVMLTSPPAPETDVVPVAFPP